MDKQRSEIPFATILGSAVHDMKNSLGMLLSTLEEMSERCVEHECGSAQQFSQLQYEAKRVNSDLIQLLALYRLEEVQYAPNLAPHSVYDFLEDQLLLHRQMLSFRGISVDVECPADLNWTFDQDLVAGVIGTVVNNCSRYARSHVQIGAAQTEGMLCLSVEDDGEGYPSAMLEQAIDQRPPLDFSKGRTGLGLYYAQVIGAAHQRRGRVGYIRLHNASRFDGGCFALYLP